MNLPTLYKKTERGVSTWEVSHDETRGLIKWGYAPNNQLTWQTRQKPGTAKQAQAMWQKKINEGYTTDEHGCVQEIIPSPMLAHTYKPGVTKINFPVWTQPKLDGVRVIWKNKRFYSRLKNHFPALDFLARQVESEHILDGKIYVHGWTFNRIISAVKRLQPDTHNLQFCCFDAVIPTVDFFERLSQIPQNIRLSSAMVGNEDDLHNELQHQLLNGFEGIMIRDQYEHYLNKRTKALLKYKVSQTQDYPIVDADQDIEGGVVWVCTTNGRVFGVRPRGTLYERKLAFLSAATVVGKKLLTVKFQELTPNGVSRFPVGICIRDYE